ncbi:hypothetical protein [Nitrosomonas ureae]
MDKLSVTFLELATGVNFSIHFCRVN